jgi:hypothetical protein
MNRSIYPADIIKRWKLSPSGPPRRARHLMDMLYVPGEGFANFEKVQMLPTGEWVTHEEAGRYYDAIHHLQDAGHEIPF